MDKIARLVLERAADDEHDGFSAHSRTFLRSQKALGSKGCTCRQSDLSTRGTKSFLKSNTVDDEEAALQFSTRILYTILSTGLNNMCDNIH